MHSCRTPHRLGLACLLLFGAALAPCFASRGALEKPYLSSDLQEKLQNLPYGMAEGKSLFIRYRHVDAVQFFGGGTQSRFSFKRGQSLLNEGLSMRLVQNGKGNWSSGAIQFRKPIDVRPYNSFVVWVWPSRSNMRLWVGLKGGGSTARTDALPSQGFPANEPTQLVIPFSRFSPKSKLEWSSIKQVYVEFGHETAGNSPRGALQILGIAFVEQQTPLRQAMVVLGRTGSQVVLGEPLANLDQEAPEDINPSSLSAPDDARPFLKMSEEETSGFFWQNENGAVLPAESAPMPEMPTGIFYLIFVAVLTILWFFLLRRRAETVATGQLGKVLTEIHWPFSIAQPFLHRKVEREFWAGVADQQERFAWLSTTDLHFETGGPGEYFGEAFLRRQIETAAEVGVQLFPSLSFTNSLFRKEGYQPNLDRSSIALRTLAIETLLRFASTALGARIENAAELFSMKVRRESSEREFWAEVIAEVRAKKPGFLFVADKVGDQAKLAREVGFDFYESNLFVDTLLDQLRAGKVGDARAFLRGEAASHLNRSIFDVCPFFSTPFQNDNERHQSVLGALILSLLPGVVQHDSNIPADLAGFIRLMAPSPLVRSGRFALLSTNNPSVLAFARWQKKSVMIAVANFSPDMQSDAVGLRPLIDGFESNKLYLFNNTLHGLPALKNLLNQPPSDGPALALWGQNIREAGVPVSMPGLSLNLFSVTLGRNAGDAVYLPEIDKATLSPSNN